MIIKEAIIQNSLIISDLQDSIQSNIINKDYDIHIQLQMLKELKRNIDKLMDAYYVNLIEGYIYEGIAEYIGLYLYKWSHLIDDVNRDLFVDEITDALREILI